MELEAELRRALLEPSQQPQQQREGGDGEGASSDSDAEWDEELAGPGGKAKPAYAEPDRRKGHLNAARAAHRVGPARASGTCSPSPLPSVFANIQPSQQQGTQKGDLMSLIDSAAAECATLAGVKGETGWTGWSIRRRKPASKQA
jgi:hypothetical protein